MTPRSIRRAAERKARKEMERQACDQATRSAASPLRARDPLCWNTERDDASATEPHALFSPAPLSPQQLAANRANAQLSTGPISSEGKVKSSLNAVTTALTGRTVLLPSEDATAYEAHLRAYQEDLRPVGGRESDLVQSIADSAWRLKRIPSLEAAIFAQGHLEFGEAFDHHAPYLRAGMVELQTFMKYEKQLRNLQLQESRLSRRREKELAELRQLQQQRREAEQEAFRTVVTRYQAAQAAGQTCELSANGFVFSKEQIEEQLQYLARNRPVAATYDRPTKQVA